MFVLQTIHAWGSCFRIFCPSQLAGPVASRRERGANS